MKASWWWSEGTEYTATKVSKLCPLVLLVKVICSQGKELGSKEARVMGNGLLEYAAEVIRAFRLWFEIC